MVALFGPNSFIIERVPGTSITIIEKAIEKDDRCRVLKMERGNLLDVSNIEVADIVMLETDVPSEYHYDTFKLLSNLKIGARTLTYLDLPKIWNYHIFPFKQVSINRSIADRFPTSWSVQRGHHFYLWSVVDPEEADDFEYVGNNFSLNKDYFDNSYSAYPTADGFDPVVSPRTASSLPSIKSYRNLNKSKSKDSHSSADQNNTDSNLVYVKQDRPVLNFFRRIFSFRKNKLPVISNNTENTKTGNNIDKNTKVSHSKDQNKEIRDDINGCWPAFSRKSPRATDTYEVIFFYCINNILIFDYFN